MTDVQNSLFSNIKYYCYFVTRAFFLAIFCFLILIAILFVVYLGDYFINVQSGNNNYPLFGGYVIVSPSMVPTINVNDAIMIKRSSSGKYNVGDIVSYYSSNFGNEDKIITHRVIEKDNTSSEGDVYVTKGDNNPSPDRYGVLSSSIYGKVFLIIPKLGYVQSFLSQPTHFIFAIIIPAFIVFFSDIMKIHKVIKKTKSFC